MVTNADTDGDLLAVRHAREDAPGTPAPGTREDSSGDDFAGVSSRDLGKTARRLVDALAHRTDETALAELRRLAASLDRVTNDPGERTASADATKQQDPVPQTEPGQEPVWDHWFR